MKPFVQSAFSQLPPDFHAQWVSLLPAMVEVCIDAPSERGIHPAVLGVAMVAAGLRVVHDLLDPAAALALLQASQESVVEAKGLPMINDAHSLQ